MKQGYKPVQKIVSDINNTTYLDEFERDRKYYCSKCKLFIDNRCSAKRIIRVCRKKRLRNVPIQESK